MNGDQWGLEHEAAGDGEDECLAAGEISRSTSRGEERGGGRADVGDSDTQGP